MNALRPLINRKAPSTLLPSRSFHVTPPSAESSKQRAARLKKSQNISKRAKIDAQDRAARPHPVLGLSEENMSKWETSKLYKTLVHPEDLKPRTSTSSTQKELDFSSPTDVAHIDPPPLLNFGLTPTTADHLLNTIPKISASLATPNEPKKFTDSLWLGALEPTPKYDSYNLQASSPRTQVIKAAKNQSEAMSRIVDLRNASARGISYENRRRIIDAFARPAKDPRNGPDTGSPEVQAALITAKIRNVWEHLKRPGNSRDVHSRRALTMLVHQRAKVLRYLKRENPIQYDTLLADIGVERGAVEGEIVIR